MNAPLIDYDANGTGGGGASAGEEKLPFDAWTVAKSALRWRWYFVGWAIICGLFAAAAAWFLAPRVWKAETILIYQPPTSEMTKNLFPAPSIQTQLNLVKTAQMLAETRRQLALPRSLDEIGAACEVTIPRDSQLLQFQVKWNDPTKAASIVNTLSRIFTDLQHEKRREELQRVIADIELRLGVVRGKIENSGAAQRSALNAQQRQEQIRALYHRMESARQDLANTIADRRGAAKEIEALDEMIIAERDKIKAAAEGAAKNSSLSELNMRAERLQERIEQERRDRIVQQERADWEARLRHSKKLLELGIMPGRQYAKEQADYRRWTAQTEDTESILKLKKDREQIFDAMSLSGSGAVTNSATMRELQSKHKALELEITGLNERIAARRLRCAELDQKYQGLLFQQHSEGSPGLRLLTDWRKQEDELSDTLASLRTIYNSNTPDFKTVSEAEPDFAPVKSYRKLVFAAIAGMGAFLGLISVAAYEVLDTTIKSPAEVQLRLEAAVLGQLPEVRRDSEGWQDRLLEPIRAVVCRVRAQIPKKGARLIVLSAGVDEGSTTVSAHMARCLGQQGEKVLLLDGDVRHAKQGEDLREIVEPEDLKTGGLGDYLTGDATIDQVTWPTTLFGVECVPRSDAPVVPELLSSRKMFKLMNKLADQHDVVLIDGPPASSSADAEILAAQADGIILVVQSRRFRSADLKKVLDRLSATGAPMLGVVINRVDSLFMDS